MFGYATNPLKLRQLRPLRVENSNLGNQRFGGVAEGVADALPLREGAARAASAATDEADLEERAAIAEFDGGAPRVYADAFASLQCQRPLTVSDADWRQAINDAGLFLDEWGALAAEFQWKAVDLFDVPRDGRLGGLAWFLEGEAVRALGPEHVRLSDGRVFDRLAMNRAGKPGPLASTSRRYP